MMPAGPASDDPERRVTSLTESMFSAQRPRWWSAWPACRPMPRKRRSRSRKPTARTSSSLDTVTLIADRQGTDPHQRRLMVIGRGEGVTHERIGPVETVTEAEGGLHLGGACPDAWIDPACCSTPVTGGKVYPRLELVDAGGETLFSIVGMEGLEGFAAPFAGLPRKAVPPRDAGPREEAAELDPADPACQPFQAVQEQGAETRITVDNGTPRQSWSGRIEGIKPAMPRTVRRSHPTTRPSTGWRRCSLAAARPRHRGNRDPDPGGCGRNPQSRGRGRHPARSRSDGVTSGGGARICGVPQPVRFTQRAGPCRSPLAGFVPFRPAEGYRARGSPAPSASSRRRDRRAARSPAPGRSDR